MKIQAIFEKGVFRPLAPVTEIGENSKVLLSIVLDRDRSLASQGSDVTQEIWESLKQSLLTAQSNVRDPQLRQQADSGMDQLREKIYQREGLLDVVVPTVREMRDEE